jgi:glycosyltransferase involved in cell wall biosynthesis
VIHGGVPVETFFHQRVDWPAVDSPLRALYVGQLTPDRGLATVLEAVARLPRGVALTVAGDGPAEFVERIRARVGRPDLAGRVSLLGQVGHDTLPAVYRAHDVLVFASTRAEGLPLSMVEAMLAGCAVLTTDSGGAAEVAAAAALTPFPGGDADALAARIDALARDRGELRRCAERGQQAALTQFTLAQTSVAYLAMLERVVAAARASGSAGRAARAS